MERKTRGPAAYFVDGALREMTLPKAQPVGRVLAFRVMSGENAGTDLAHVVWDRYRGPRIEEWPGLYEQAVLAQVRAFGAADTAPGRLYDELYFRIGFAGAQVVDLADVGRAARVSDAGAALAALVDAGLVLCGDTRHGVAVSLPANIVCQEEAA